MSESRKRNHDIHIRLDDQEYEAFMDGYKKSGLQNQRDFILSMCLKGYIVRVDTSGLNKVAEELNKIGVNINQIAYKVNSTGALSAPDLKVLQKDMADIFSIIKKEFNKYKNTMKKP